MLSKYGHLQNRTTFISPDLLIYGFILLHIIGWTLAPALIRFTLPMDAMEGTTWGHQLEWGYDKNPFMNGWLTALAIHISGASGWATYLFSQLSVALCFWAVWQLGKKMLPPWYAVIAVLLLESNQYYNLHAIDFNDNTLELGFWALTILYFYQAIREEKLLYWLLTGLFAGISLMSKYYTIVLLIPMGLFLLARPDTRAQFKKANLYYSLIALAIVITPHIIWLFGHDFITINYVFDRAKPRANWSHLFNRVYFPTLFAWQQIQGFLPILILTLTLYFGKTKNQVLLEKTTHINSFDRLFLIFMGLGPLLLTLLISACTGIKLRGGWGQPLLSLWSIILLAWLLPPLTRAIFNRFVIIISATFVTFITTYCIALMHADEPSSANYPGKNIAKTLTHAWHERYHKPLTYVVGYRWVAGNIALYSTDKPAVYLEANNKISPWIAEEKLRREGGVFVWDPTEAIKIPYAQIKTRFPNLGPQEVMHFTWLRNLTMTPVEISVAYLPPENV